MGRITVVSFYIIPMKLKNIFVILILPGACKAQRN